MATDDRPRRTRKAPGERTAEILAAAIAIAGADGLGALTVRSVAERAGVTQGLVAHYFPSMHELVARAYRELVGAEVAEVRAIVAGRRDHRQRMLDVLATVLDGSREEVTVLWVEGWALGRSNAALAAAVREQMDAWHALLAEVIAEGATAGELVVDDAGRAAWQVLAIVDGVNAHSLVREVDPTSAMDDAMRGVATLLGLEASSPSVDAEH
ncbi:MULTISPECIES: TetR/AcrR family transcriptional regulator [unclassified Agrococcus]|uniref:TetR/AcrR family transcriptional regulator n=1 Tax=unclassified Agrococcus TaxID=2615065 RepID=UPI003611A595